MKVHRVRAHDHQDISQKQPGYQEKESFELLSKESICRKWLRFYLAMDFIFDRAIEFSS